MLRPTESSTPAVRWRSAPSPLARAAAVAALAALTAGGAAVVRGGGFTPDATQPPVANPVLSPNDCASCHGDFEAFSHHEPHPTWAGSMMANASRDPIFWAALDVANDDVPGIGDFCLRCHVPTGWLAGRSEPPGGSADGCGLLGNLDQDAADFSGVSCHLCHRMMVNPSPPPGEAPVYYENGKYWIDDGDCGGEGEPCRRGPYDFPIGGPNVPPPHAWAFSQYHVDADVCGNCHNVTNPVETLIDENGVDTGIPFPIERTFDEWQASAYSAPGAGFSGCQDCHMPPALPSPVYACLFEQNDRTDDLPVHQFAGGNAWVPRVLRDEYIALADRADSFDATIAWALDMLQNRSAEVALTAPSFVPPEGELGVEVEVTNLSGHKLPTGYFEGRRMWLQLEVRDGAGGLLLESGAYDPLTGELADDPQLKVYRREAGIWDLHGTGECDTEDALGNAIFHFVRNNCVVVDNRIPPAGFTAGGDPEVRPVGYAYPETSPGSGVLVHWDVTPYAATLPPDTPSPLSVTARLYYQTTTDEYVGFLRDQAVVNGFPDDCLPRASGSTPAMSRGEILHDMWTRYERAPPVLMGTASAVVAVVDAVFYDGFESGDTTAWSATTP